MGNFFFGSSKKKLKAKEIPPKAPQAQITEKDRAVLDLKNARDRLNRYKKKLEKESEKLTNEAKELIQRQQKTRALLVLKLRKHKEKAVESCDAQLLSVLQMMEDLEWESANMDVLRALKSGTTQLNALHEEMSADDVAALLDETNEAIEMENQINSLLAGQAGQLDDAELEAEYLTLISPESGNAAASPRQHVQQQQQQPQIIQEEEEQKQDLDLPAAPSGPILPAAPTTEPTRQPRQTREVQQQQRQAALA